MKVRSTMTCPDPNTVPGPSPSVQAGVCLSTSPLSDTICPPSLASSDFGPILSVAPNSLPPRLRPAVGSLESPGPPPANPLPSPRPLSGHCFKRGPRSSFEVSTIPFCLGGDWPSCVCKSGISPKNGRLVLLLANTLDHSASTSHRTGYKR